MKILLVGEYSNVHNTLATGLRQLGHEVLVVSNGDYWKNYPRDVDVARDSGRTGGVRLYLKILSLLPRLCGYDIVQLINPMFFDLKAERLFRIYDFLRRHNKRVVLGAFGMDYYWAWVNSHVMPLRYSDFNIGEKRRTDSIATHDYNDWVGTTKEKLNRHIASTCDAIIAGLYEYKVTYDKTEHRNKTVFIPFPIVCNSNNMKRRPENTPITLFIGISHCRSQYKGTDIMLRAAQRIANDYPGRIILEVADGVPFAEYTKMLDRADVILDQLYAYTPAMNALEAMSRGTVVVGGGEEEQYELIGENELRPIVNVQPTEQSVYEQLEHLVLYGNIAQMQHDAQTYVHRHHDYIKVAKEYENLYTRLLA